MLRNTVRALAILLVLSPVTLVFQNCGGSFESVGLNSLGLPPGGQEVITGQLSISSAYPQETLTHIVPVTISANSDIATFDLNALTLNNTTATLVSQNAREIRLLLKAQQKGNFGFTINTNALSFSAGALSAPVNFSHVLLDRAATKSTSAFCEKGYFYDNHLLCNTGEIWNLTNPQVPVFVTRLPYRETNHILKTGNLVIRYARNYTTLPGIVEFYDISNPQAPTLVSSFVPQKTYNDKLYLMGSLLIMPHEHGVDALNFQNPAQPSFLPTFGADPQFPTNSVFASVNVIGEYVIQDLYYNNEYKVFRVTPQGGTLVSTIPQTAVGPSGDPNITFLSWTLNNGVDRVARIKAQEIEVFGFANGQFTLQRTIPFARPAEATSVATLTGNVLSFKASQQPLVQIDISTGSSVTPPAALLSVEQEYLPSQTGILAATNFSFGTVFFDYRNGVNQTPMLFLQNRYTAVYGQRGLVVGDQYIATGIDGTLSAFPLNTNALRPTSTITLPNTEFNNALVAQVYRSGEHLIAVAGRSIHSIHMPNGSTMNRVGSVELPTGNFAGNVLQGNYLYVAHRDVNDVYTLRTYNLTNPASPVLTATLPAVAVWQLHVIGNYLYAFGLETLYVYNISNPASPVAVTATTPPIQSGSYNSTQSGNHIYRTLGANLQIFDVSTPTAPTVVSTTLPNIATNQMVSVFARGPYLYATHSGAPGIYVYDISNPTSPSYYTLISSQGGILSSQSIGMFDQKLFVFGMQPQCVSFSNVPGVF